MQKILNNKSFHELNTWKDLVDHQKKIKNKSILDHFKDESKRIDYTWIEWEDFVVDFSKNRIDKKGFNLLLKLAKNANLKAAIESQFKGAKINATENRAVLHTALRTLDNSPILVDEKDVIPKIKATQEKMFTFCKKVISGKWKGYTGKSITHIVNIGIGGSDLGPAMVVESLAHYKNHLEVRFISNVEGDHHEEVLKELNHETTLFIIVSKTFTTQETLSNAKSIRSWFLNQAPEKAISDHFVAVSTNVKMITDFGISIENTFPMEDWVGGRFSLWSTVGMSICLSVGPDHYKNLLQGAGKMDLHFRYTSFEKNLPVVLALISVWYNNFWNAESEAIIPYTQYLRSFPAFLQQGIMESNGKSVGRDGKAINYQTGTIIWGASGTNAQHAFFQLIHQGTRLIPSDFICFKKSLKGNKEHQTKLLSNFIAQTEALMKGKNKLEVKKELDSMGIDIGEQKKITPFKIFEGNKPSNTILIDQLTPSSLGKLIALYEHKIFVQGIIWNIYSYDQWGVELGKQLANKILQDIEGKPKYSHDPSTSKILNLIKSSF